MTKSSLDILKQIFKHETFESVMYNNKQVAEDDVKSCLDDFFPKLLSTSKKYDHALFLKMLKNQQFYAKLRLMIMTHFELQKKYEQIEDRYVSVGKISVNDQSNNEPNKKLTRAALAKRNQETQQQLRRDQIYVRLVPKNDSSCHWMLCHRNFPRIECKLSCNQHIEYLVNYLSNKWLRGLVGFKVALYPDAHSFVKGASHADKEKIVNEPLNNYFMFTDIMTGSNVGQNGTLNLQYEIIDLKKQTTKSSNKTSANKFTKPIVNNKISESKKQRKQAKAIRNDSFDSKVFHENQNSFKLHSPNNGFESNLNRNSLRLNSINPHSIGLLANNESNLLNPKHSIYQQDDSMLKSIGFFSLTGNNNNQSKKQNVAELGSNSGVADLENQTNQLKKQEEPEQSMGLSKDGKSQTIGRHEKVDDLRNAISFMEQVQGFQEDAKGQEISQKSVIKEVKTVSIKKKTGSS